MNVDTSDWQTRNVERLGDERMVRRAFKLLAYTPNSGSWNVDKVYGGFSVRNERTDRVWHYVIGKLNGGGTGLVIADENYNEIQTQSLLTSVEPADVTCSVVADEIMIGIPGLPTLWGIVGGGMQVATLVATTDINFTDISAIPQGLCVSWAGRNVIADNNLLYISDPLYPRTYVGANVLDSPGGVIYGLHVNAGGALIIVTSQGVWALPEDAAVSGTLVVGVWSKLTDFSIMDFRQSCCSLGNVYGLTSRGFRRIDKEGAEEVLLNEEVISRTFVKRMAFDDYRRGKIFGGQRGLYVTIEDYMYVADFLSNYASWWTSSAIGLDLRGIHFEQDGSEFFLFDQAQNTFWYTLNGNDDSVESSVKAQIAGRIPAYPDSSPVIRYVAFATDSFRPVQISIKGTSVTATPVAVSPVIGTDAWGSPLYSEPPLQSVQTDWAVRGVELAVEVQVEQHPHRLPPNLNIQFKGPGRKRPGRST